MIIMTIINSMGFPKTASYKDKVEIMGLSKLANSRVKDPDILERGRGFIFFSVSSAH